MDNSILAKVKNVALKISNTTTYVALSVTNVILKSYTISDCYSVYPYGQGGYPQDNTNVFLSPIQGSNKTYICLGFVNGVPTNLPYVFKQGESWGYSKRYLLSYQNDAINAYRFDDNNFTTTLPQGQFMGSMMLNRINELQEQITYLTTLVSQLQAHTHTYLNVGVPTPTSSPLSVFSIPTTPTTLAKDTNLINNENYLINDKGIVYPT